MWPDNVPYGQSAAADLASKWGTDDIRLAVEELQGRLERQGLLLRAVFALASEQLGISEQDLLRRVHELAPPGGPFAKAPLVRRPCPKCGSILGHRRNRCMFCGEDWVVESPFEYLDIGADPVGPAPEAEPAPPKIPSESIRRVDRGDS